MKIIPIQDFSNGIADDYTNGGVGEFSITKQFDILSYPKRLQPLRGMTTDTADTGIGNLLTLSTDGNFYGLGWLTANHAIADIWTRASGAWVASGLGGTGTTGIFYNLFVEFPSAASGRTIIFSYTNFLIAYSPTGGGSATQALTFTSIGQGFVHPKDKVLYIPYKTSTTSVIGTLANGAAITAFVPAQFSIPNQYTVPCLTNYGNYLAIPAYNANGISNNPSIVYLWDRDTSNTLPNESINWGGGQLKVLNNLNGTLIGISQTVNSAVDDSATITIKGYDGGTEPYLIKEITATRMTSTPPSVTINPIVNYIHKNRLYFSVNIVNGGNAPARYGLWSVGKNKSGRWTVTMERVATNTNTDTGVLAATAKGDMVSMVHTAVGTLTISTTGTGRQYGATSVYESTVNPEMEELDRDKQKKLMSVWVTCMPLSDINNDNSSIVMKYRVDNRTESVSDSSSWITIGTKTSNSPVTTSASDSSNSKLTFMECTKPISGQFQDGRKYEFRLESTNGAIITGWGYKYDLVATNI